MFIQLPDMGQVLEADGGFGIFLTLELCHRWKDERVAISRPFQYLVFQSSGQ